MTILWYMALNQVIYDLTYFLQSFLQNRVIHAISDGFQQFSGLSVTFWTNLISFVTFYIVQFQRSYDVIGYFKITSAIILVPSVIIGLLTVYFDLHSLDIGYTVVHWLYYSLRLVSILVNFLFFVVIQYRIWTMFTSSTLTDAESAHFAIVALSKRVLLYPVMQLIVRLPRAVYEAQYGFSQYPGNTSPSQFALSCVCSITEPSAGTGYLIIFLVMQPDAYKMLVRLLSRLCLCCDCTTCDKQHQTYSFDWNRNSGIGKEE